jgi:hypothetical protein
MGRQCKGAQGECFFVSMARRREHASDSAQTRPRLFPPSGVPTASDGALCRNPGHASCPVTRTNGPGCRSGAALASRKKGASESHASAHCSRLALTPLHYTLSRTTPREPHHQKDECTPPPCRPPPAAWPRLVRRLAGPPQCARPARRRRTRRPLKARPSSSREFFCFSFSFSCVDGPASPCAARLAPSRTRGCTQDHACLACVELGVG